MTGTHQGYKFLSRSARTNLPCGQAGQALHRFTSEAAQPSPFSPSESRERSAEPPCGHARPPESPEEKRLAGSPGTLGRGTRGNSALNGGHSVLSRLWCQVENTTRYCGKVAAVNIVIWGRRTKSRWCSGG